MNKEKIIKKKKGLSLKPYFQRRNISEEEIKEAKENSERTRKKLEKPKIFLTRSDLKILNETKELNINLDLKIKLKVK